MGEGSAFHVNINDKSAYEGSKLRKLLSSVNYLMEETLRNLTEESLQRYCVCLYMRIYMIVKCCEYS
jgi:hypothetical protein